MVSLIEHSDCYHDEASDEYTVALSNFLSDRKIEIDSQFSFSNANDASVHALIAIKENNKKRFIEIYQSLCTRNPKPDSDWIHNEIFIFSFVLGVCKFKLDTQWLVKVLDLRISHSQGDNKLVAQSFIDVLNGNFESINNFQPLILVYKYYLDLPIPTY